MALRRTCATLRVAPGPSRPVVFLRRFLDALGPTSSVALRDVDASVSYASLFRKSSSVVVKTAKVVDDGDDFDIVRLIETFEDDG